LLDPAYRTIGLPFASKPIKAQLTGWQGGVAHPDTAVTVACAIGNVCVPVELSNELAGPRFWMNSWALPYMVNTKSPEFISTAWAVPLKPAMSITAIANRVKTRYNFLLTLIL